MGRLHLGMGIGMGLQSGAASAPTTPLTILGAAVLQWCRADLGITTATGVSGWADQSGAGKDYAQATGGAQPAYDASGGPNSTPFLNFDGTDDFMQAALALPDPTTTPSLCYLVFRQDSYTAGDRIFGDSAGFRLVLYQTGGTPLIRITATVDGPTNNAAAIGSWVRGIAYFSDSTSDYLQVKATKVTGTNVASAAGTARQIGCSGSASFGDVSIAEIVWANRDLTGSELTSMDAYVTSRYGSGLTS